MANPILDKFAIQLFSVRDSFNKDPRDTLKKVKELGYSGVEIAGFASLTPEEFKAACDEEGLEIYSIHGGKENFTEEAFGHLINEMKATGCTRFVYAWLPHFDSIEPVKQVCEDFKKYAAMLKEYGFEFFFHNHGNDLEIIDGEKSVIEYIMEQVPEMYIELDTGWCNYGGNESCSFIEKYHDRIKLIHLKQLDGYGDIKITELPNGNVIDVPPIVEVCKKYGIDQFIVEQDNTDKHDLESAKINADYLLGR